MANKISTASQNHDIHSVRMSLKDRAVTAKNWFFTRSLIVKVIIVVGVVALAWLAISKFRGTSTKTTYQTDTATKGTLIVTVTASGNVSSANSAVVTTSTSGVVSKIFVKNGDQVKSGDPIAQVDLDMDGKQRADQALASYQSAQNSVNSAQANMYSLQSSMFSKWKTYTDIAENSTYQNPDGSANTSNRTLTPFTTTQDDWLAAEAQYKNQQGVVAAAQTSLSSAWANYQKTSPTIYAPISGTISGLSFQVGSVLTAQTSSTGTSTSQRIANIKTEATPVAVVNLNEVDVPKVLVGDKATVTMDAFPAATFTGKIVGIDTTGTVSSGVTTYPAYIVYDSAIDGIYPNMAVDASIISLVKDGVVLVPNAAVQTSTNGQSTVRIMKNGQVSTVDVTVGASNDTQTEIVSGVTDGDTVVTGVTTTGRTSTTTAASPFSTIGGRAGFSGGGR
ncbi:MAG: efflux RND transporter periplasmic adaptor subunit [Candidatus Gottesmanbacteria bacterium]|nr:efflux RND transporter periplasmic adaptor subunit [Candidatus Gottesmanbacteria bacterium]